MATEADVLRSVNLILQSGERREQGRLDTALTMMAFQQQKRAADVDILTKKLQVATAANTEMQSGIVSDLLTSTGLGSYYQQTEDADERHEYQKDALDALVDDIGLAPEVARGAVQGLWSWYEAKNPRELISLASNLGKSVQSLENKARIDPTGASIDPNSGEARLVRSFINLQKESKGVGDIKAISLQALKNLENERNIQKESFEMVKGDYEIQSDIGVYEDIRDPMKQFTEDKQDFWSTEQGIQLVNQAIKQSETDEDWDGEWQVLAAVGLTAGPLITQGVQSEVSKAVSGKWDFLRQLSKDLKDPRKGGLRWGKEWKERYPGTDKGQVKHRGTTSASKKQMKIISDMASKAARANTTSATAMSRALDAVSKSRVLSATKTGFEYAGKGVAAGKYFAPMALGELGEYIGGEEGGAIGRGVGGSGIVANVVYKKGKQSFASFMARRAAATGVKMGALAMADSPFLPIGDFLALGFGALEVYHAYKDWQAYIEE